jgi:hypothetical protein
MGRVDDRASGTPSGTGRTAVHLPHDRASGDAVPGTGRTAFRTLLAKPRAGLRVNHTRRAAITLHRDPAALRPEPARNGLQFTPVAAWNDWRKLRRA